MLGIVPSCNLVQYQEKLMMQPWENGKNPFSWVLPLLVVRQCSKLSSYAVSRKTNEANLKKKTKKTNFGPVLAYFGPNLGHQFFCRFYFYYPMRLKGKLMNQTWENGKKPNIGSNFVCLAKIWAPKYFLWVLAPLVVRNYSKLSSYAI